MTLHWLQYFLLLGLISTTNPTAPWAIAYGIVAILWPAVAVVFGRHGRGGPKLDATGLAFHRWHHRVFYLASASAGGMAILWAYGTPFALQYWLFLFFMVSNLHALFHLWRHTVLRDGALRMIIPRALHKLL